MIGLHVPGDAEPPVLLLLHGTGDNTLEGIDPFTGAQRWSCPGPTPRSRFGWIRMKTTKLLNEDNALPPQVFFHSGHVAQCRQATLLGTTPLSTKGTTPEIEMMARLRVEPIRQPAPNDPRLTRQLPWNRVGELVREVGKYWIWATLYCVSLILLPIGWIVSLCRRRQWGMRTLALLPVVAAVFLLGPGIQDLECITFFNSHGHLDYAYALEGAKPATSRG